MADTQGFVPWNIAEFIANGKKSIRFRSRLNGRVFSFALTGWNDVYHFVEIINPEPDLQWNVIYHVMDDNEVKKAILTAVMQA